MSSPIIDNVAAKWEPCDENPMMHFKFGTSEVLPLSEASTWLFAVLREFDPSFGAGLSPNVVKPKAKGVPRRKCTWLSSIHR